MYPSYGPNMYRFISPDPLRAYCRRRASLMSEEECSSFGAMLMALPGTVRMQVLQSRVNRAFERYQEHSEPCSVCHQRTLLWKLEPCCGCSKPMCRTCTAWVCVGCERRMCLPCDSREGPEWYCLGCEGRNIEDDEWYCLGYEWVEEDEVEEDEAVGGQ